MVLLIIIAQNLSINSLLEQIGLWDNGKKEEAGMKAR